MMVASMTFPTQESLEGLSTGTSQVFAGGGGAGGCSLRSKAGVSGAEGARVPRKEVSQGNKMPWKVWGWGRVWRPGKGRREVGGQRLPQPTRGGESSPGLASGPTRHLEGGEKQKGDF